jgi:hypothetical protein
VAKFTAHFDAARDYTLHFIIAHRYPSAHGKVFTSRCFVAASTADISNPLVSRIVPALSYQFLTATAQNYSRAAVL